MKNPFSEKETEATLNARFCTSDKIVFPPFAGEFGLLCAQVLRQFDLYEAQSKVVCCPSKQKVFYPSATKFYHDFEYSRETLDIPRKGMGSFFKRIEAVKIAREFIDTHPKYADHEIWYPRKRNCFKDSELFTHSPVFKPKKQCDPVDVVFSYRKRGLHAKKNTSPELYRNVLKKLKKFNFKTGIVGAKGKSGNTDNIDCRAWDYANEDDATIEMIQKSKLVISTNTGIAHLTILLGKPLMLVTNNEQLVPLMQISRKPNVFFHKITTDEFKNAGHCYVLNYLNRES